MSPCQQLSNWAHGDSAGREVGSNWIKMKPLSFLQKSACLNYQRKLSGQGKEWLLWLLKPQTVFDTQEKGLQNIDSVKEALQIVHSDSWFVFYDLTIMNLGTF
jgi:hypothetical protein